MSACQRQPGCADQSCDCEQIFMGDHTRNKHWPRTYDVQARVPVGLISAAVMGLLAGQYGLKSYPQSAYGGCEDIKNKPDQQHGSRNEP